MAKNRSSTPSPGHTINDEAGSSATPSHATALAALREKAASRDSNPDFLRQRSTTGSFRISSSAGWQPDEAIAGMRDTIDWGKSTPALCTVATMIHPSSRLRVAWDLGMMSIILLLCLYLPFQLAFEDTHPDQFAFAFTLDACLVVLFSVDIVINCRTGYYEDESGSVVMDPWRSFLVYLRFWLIIDLAATIPWDWIVSSSVDDSAANVPRLLRALKLYRVAKLARLLRLFRVFRLRSTVKETLEDFNINRNLVSLVGLLVQVLSVAHLLSCGFFFIAQLEGALTKTWVGAQDLADASISRQYLTAFYFVVALQTSVGFGDVVPETDGERMYVIAGMLLAAGVYGYAIAKLSYLVSELNVERRTYNQKMNEVQAYMELRHIPHDLRVQIRQYFKYSLARRTVYDERAVMEMLSTQLQKDVARHMQQMVSDIPFFDGADTSFVRAVLPLLKPVFFAAKQGILREGTFGTDMYFIKKGTVRVVLDKGIQTEIPIAVLTDGALFGEMALMLDEQNSRRCATVRAITDCETFTASWMELRPILMEFSDVLETMLDESIKRSRETSSKRRMRAWSRAKSVRNSWIIPKSDPDSEDPERARTMTAWTRALEQTMQAPAKLRVQNLVTAATIDQVFAQFDADQSGSIDMNEYQAMLPMLGFRLSPGLQRTTFNIIDNNGDKSIDLEEFRAAMLVLQRFQAMHRDALEEKFDAKSFAAHFANVHSQGPEQQRRMQQQTLVAMAQQDEDMKVQYREDLKKDYEALLAKHRETLQAARRERRRRKEAEAKVTSLAQAAAISSELLPVHLKQRTEGSQGSGGSFTASTTRDGVDSSPTTGNRPSAAGLFRRTLSRWSSLGDGSRGSPKRVQSGALDSSAQSPPSEGRLRPAKAEEDGEGLANTHRFSSAPMSPPVQAKSGVLGGSTSRSGPASRSHPNQEAASVSVPAQLRALALPAQDPASGQGARAVRLAPLPMRTRRQPGPRGVPSSTGVPMTPSTTSDARLPVHVDAAGSVSAMTNEGSVGARRPRQWSVSVGVAASYAADAVNPGPIPSPVHRAVPRSGKRWHLASHGDASCSSGLPALQTLGPTVHGLDTVTMTRADAAGVEPPDQTVQRTGESGQRRGSAPSARPVASRGFGLGREVVLTDNASEGRFTGIGGGSGAGESETDSPALALAPAASERAMGSGPVGSLASGQTHLASARGARTGSSSSPTTADGSGLTRVAEASSDPSAAGAAHSRGTGQDAPPGTEFDSLRSSSTGYRSVRPHALPGARTAVDESPTRSMQPVEDGASGQMPAGRLPAGTIAVDTDRASAGASAGAGGALLGMVAGPRHPSHTQASLRGGERALLDALGSMQSSNSPAMTGVTLPTVAPRSGHSDQEESLGKVVDAAGLEGPSTSAIGRAGSASDGTSTPAARMTGGAVARPAARKDLGVGPAAAAPAAGHAANRRARRGSNAPSSQNNETIGDDDGSGEEEEEEEEEDADDGKDGRDQFNSQSEMRALQGYDSQLHADAQSDRSDTTLPFTAPADGSVTLRGGARASDDSGAPSRRATVEARRRRRRSPSPDAPIFDDGPTDPDPDVSEAATASSLSQRGRMAVPSRAALARQASADSRRVPVAGIRPAAARRRAARDTRRPRSTTRGVLANGQPQPTRRRSEERDWSSDGGSGGSGSGGSGGARGGGAGAGSERDEEDEEEDEDAAEEAAAAAAAAKHAQGVPQTGGGAGSGAGLVPAGLAGHATTRGAASTDEEAGAPWTSSTDDASTARGASSGQSVVPVSMTETGSSANAVQGTAGATAKVDTGAESDDAAVANVQRADMWAPGNMPAGNHQHDTAAAAQTGGASPGSDETPGPGLHTSGTLADEASASVSTGSVPRKAAEAEDTHGPLLDTALPTRGVSLPQSTHASPLATEVHPPEGARGAGRGSDRLPSVTTEETVDGAADDELSRSADARAL